MAVFPHALFMQIYIKQGVWYNIAWFKAPEMTSVP